MGVVDDGGVGSEGDRLLKRGQRQRPNNSQRSNAHTGVVAIHTHDTGSMSVRPLRNALAKPDLEIKERHETTSLPRSS